MCCVDKELVCYIKTIYNKMINSFKIMKNYIQKKIDYIIHLLCIIKNINNNPKIWTKCNKM